MYLKCTSDLETFVLVVIFDKHTHTHTYHFPKPINGGDTRKYYMKTIYSTAYRGWAKN